MSEKFRFVFNMGHIGHKESFIAGSLGPSKIREEPKAQDANAVPIEMRGKINQNLEFEFSKCEISAKEGVF